MANGTLDERREQRVLTVCPVNASVFCEFLLLHPETALTENTEFSVRDLSQATPLVVDDVHYQGHSLGRVLAYPGAARDAHDPCRGAGGPLRRPGAGAHRHRRPAPAGGTRLDAEKLQLLRDGTEARVAVLATVGDTGEEDEYPIQ